ncbi:MAG: type II secretion system protein GspC [Myxococcales bacterium]
MEYAHAAWRQGMELAESLFRNHSTMTFVLRRCFWMVDLGFTAAAASLCALLVGALVPRAIHIPSDSLGFSGASPVVKTALDGKAVSQVLDLPLGGTQAEPLPPTPAPTPSALSVKLLGTSVSNLPELSLATLQDLTAKDTTVYAIGDTIQGATVLDIERLRVIVDNQGRRETIDLEQSVATAGAQGPTAAAVPGLTVVGPGKYVIERKALEAFLANPGAELMKAGFVPAIEGGINRGWKLVRLTSDSLLGKLGLAQGDVIRRVAGYELTKPAALLDLATQVTRMSRVEVETDRNGAAQRLDYRITD